ncbi:MAG: 50S ribosomal protein L22 [Armatimonadetes bacterium]|nr:50S ribosomal protein L22 [Armatimonadota bacterium]
MDVRALHKWVRISPYKVRRYCALVRGMPVKEALGLLALETSPAAFELRRAIASAAANAENNHDLDPDDLVIKVADAGDATRFRRMLPRARGRADVIRKRSCHILVVVTDEEPAEEAEGRSRAGRSRASR